MPHQTSNQESHQPSETTMKLISDQFVSSFQSRFRLDPMIAIDFISIVDGKPVVDGKGLLALVRFRRDIVEWVKIDSQPTFCTVTIKRKDEEPASSTFTLEHAEKMSLMSKWNWKAQPQTMLKWRAVSQACREICSDIIGGLYTKEEISDGDMVVLEDGTMFTPELTPKREQKPNNITPLPTSANGTQPKASAPTFSTGENPPPIKVDPLTITPVPAPKSDEPDPNDPEDIRHAIPIYGADHWYVKHYLAFVKLLREVIP
ncbi:MAG: recombinase RecT, partial [bacterium]|nr:recombinase RecT [bacterium]